MSDVFFMCDGDVEVNMLLAVRTVRHHLKTSSVLFMQLLHFFSYFHDKVVISQVGELFCYGSVTRLFLHYFSL